jgi:hypothetical protein
MQIQWKLFLIVLNSSVENDVEDLSIQSLGHWPASRFIKEYDFIV